MVVRGVCLRLRQLLSHRQLLSPVCWRVRVCLPLLLLRLLFRLPLLRLLRHPKNPFVVPPSVRRLLLRHRLLRHRLLRQLVFLKRNH